jgi:ubiquinone/menaquinone biosynthesis C-methylase UbiE
MGSTQTTRIATEEYYKGYEARKGVGRNDLLRNPQVLFQALAIEASVISALRAIEPDPTVVKVLDIGCGEGASLLPFLRTGFAPENLHGVDIRPEQVRCAQRKFPAVQFQCADASRLEFPDEAFDIVQESMIFLQMTDEDLSQRVANEMLRVTKRGGHLVVSDWRYSKAGTSEFKAMDRKRVSRLFRVGSQTVVSGVYPGALIPPVGRFLSKNISSLYFVVRRVFPFLTGQLTTVLCKS